MDFLLTGCLDIHYWFICCIEPGPQNLYQGETEKQQHYFREIGVGIDSGFLKYLLRDAIARLYLSDCSRLQGLAQNQNAQKRIYP